MPINIKNLALPKAQKELFIEECGALLESFLEGYIISEFSNLELYLFGLANFCQPTPYALAGFQLMSKYLSCHNFYLQENGYNSDHINHKLLAIGLEAQYHGDTLFNQELSIFSESFVLHTYEYTNDDFPSATKQLMGGEYVALALYTVSHTE